MLLRPLQNGLVRAAVAALLLAAGAQAAGPSGGVPPADRSEPPGAPVPPVILSHSSALTGPPPVSSVGELYQRRDTVIKSLMPVHGQFSALKKQQPLTEIPKALLEGYVSVLESTGGILPEDQFVNSMAGDIDEMLLGWALEAEHGNAENHQLCCRIYLPGDAPETGRDRQKQEIRSMTNAMERFADELGERWSNNEPFRYQAIVPINAKHFVAVDMFGDPENSRLSIVVPDSTGPGNNNAEDALRDLSKQLESKLPEEALKNLRFSYFPMHIQSSMNGCKLFSLEAARELSRNGEALHANAFASSTGGMTRLGSNADLAAVVPNLFRLAQSTVGRKLFFDSLGDGEREKAEERFNQDNVRAFVRINRETRRQEVGQSNFAFQRIRERTLRQLQERVTSGDFEADHAKYNERFAERRREGGRELSQHLAAGLEASRESSRRDVRFSEREQHSSTSRASTSSSPFSRDFAAGEHSRSTISRQDFELTQQNNRKQGLAGGEGRNGRLVESVNGNPETARNGSRDSEVRDDQPAVPGRRERAPLNE